MALTYPQAVELLENHGIKVSVNSNGLSVMKACALVIQRLAEENVTLKAQAKEIVVPPSESLQNAVQALKTLRLKSKVFSLQDGDMLWLQVRKEPDYEAFRHLRSAIKLVTKKDVLVVLTPEENVVRHISLAERAKFINHLLKDLRPEARAGLIKDLDRA
jgi:hypothetical protein